MKRDALELIGRPLCLAALLLLFLKPAAAQEERSLEETLSMLSGDAATEYVAPISSSLGANLNSGWFHRAPRAVKAGFSFEVGLIAMGSFFPKDANHFDVNGDFRFSRDEADMMLDFMEDEQGFTLPANVRSDLRAQITAASSSVGISGATVVGDSSDFVTISYPGQTFDVNGESFTVPAQDIQLPFGGFGDLADVPMLPLAAPQLTIGTFYGTQFTLRFLPAMELSDDLGEFKYMGFGIQHNPAMWLKKELPVDLALSLFSQSMKVGDLFECSTFALGVNASKTFGWRFLNVTPYGGLMFEDAKMKVGYDFIVETPVGTVVEPISLDLASENTMRLTLGLNLRLGIVNWNVDYSLAAYPAVSTGINLAF